MTGPSFDDTLDYWVDNPDERTLLCVACGFDSDDEFEFVAHCRSHETPVDDWAVQVECWTEAA